MINPQDNSVNADQSPEIKNSKEVIDFAKLLRDLRSAVDKTDKEVSNYISKNNESSWGHGREEATRRIFDDKIVPHFKKQLMSFASSVGNVSDEEREKQAIEAILKHVKAMILKAIEEEFKSTQEKALQFSQELKKKAEANHPITDKENNKLREKKIELEHATKVLDWLEKNRDVLLNPDNGLYRTKIAEARGYFNSKTSVNQTAWRNFDPLAPRSSTWPNLFVGDDWFGTNRNEEARKFIAYYYLVCTDPNPKDTLEFRRSNLITRLADFRRGHNDCDNGCKRGKHNDKCKFILDDDPTCMKGIRGRVGDLGQGHPVAQLMLNVSELIPDLVSGVVNLRMFSAFQGCENFMQKMAMKDALMELNAENASDIINNKIPFSDAALQLRLNCLKALGIDIKTFKESSEVLKQIEDELQEVTIPWQGNRYIQDLIDRKKLTAHGRDMCRLILLDPIRVCGQIIEDQFRHSLTPEERKSLEESEGNEAVVREPTVLEEYRRLFEEERSKEESERPKSRTTDRGHEIPAPKSVMERHQAKYISSAVRKRILDQLITDEWAKTPEALLRELEPLEDEDLLFQYDANYKLKYDALKLMPGIKNPEQDARNRTVRALFRDMEITYDLLDDNKIDKMVKELGDRIDILKKKQSERIAAQEAIIKTQTLVPVDNSKQRLEVRHYNFSEFGGLVSGHYRLRSIGMHEVDVYRQLHLPEMPVIHPYNPQGIANTPEYIRENAPPLQNEGVPAFSVALTIPRFNAHNLPQGVAQLLIDQGISPEGLDVFFCAQNRPWKSESLLLRPHPWLHPNAPMQHPIPGYSFKITNAITGLFDIQGKPTTMAHIAGIQTHRDARSEFLGYSKSQQMPIQLKGQPWLPVKTHSFYSLCIDPSEKRAALTLHWILDDSDNNKIQNLLAICDISTLGKFVNEVALLDKTDLNGTRYNKLEFSAIDALSALMKGGHPTPVSTDSDYYLSEQQNPDLRVNMGAGADAVIVQKLNLREIAHLTGAQMAEMKRKADREGGGATLNFARGINLVDSQVTADISLTRQSISPKAYRDPKPIVRTNARDPNAFTDHLLGMIMGLPKNTNPIPARTTTSVDPEPQVAFSIAKPAATNRPQASTANTIEDYSNLRLPGNLLSLDLANNSIGNESNLRPTAGIETLNLSNNQPGAGKTTLQDIIRRTVTDSNSVSFPVTTTPTVGTLRRLTIRYNHYNGAVPNALRLASPNMEEVRTYPQLHLPRLPVIHPYHPDGTSSDNRSIEIPVFCVTARITSGAGYLFPNDAQVKEILKKNRLDKSQCEVFFCAQNRPWRNQNEALLYRPHPWLHYEAPDRGTYNKSDDILLSIADIRSKFSPEISISGVSTHPDQQGNMVYSAQQMEIAGIEDRSQTHCFYTLCIHPGTRRAALTLHWLLNDQDYTLFQRDLIPHADTLDYLSTLIASQDRWATQLNESARGGSNISPNQSLFGIANGTFYTADSSSRYSIVNPPRPRPTQQPVGSQSSTGLGSTPTQVQTSSPLVFRNTSSAPPIVPVTPTRAEQFQAELKNLAEALGKFGIDVANKRYIEESSAIFARYAVESGAYDHTKAISDYIAASSDQRNGMVKFVVDNLNLKFPRPR